MREFFGKICKSLKLAVLICSSKFILTVRLLNNRRSKKNLMCDGFLREEGLHGASKSS